jgi:diacylglycerol kinase (ATP)
VAAGIDERQSDAYRRAMRGQMRQRFFLIFNRHAGTSRLSAVTKLVAALEATGATVAQSTATSTEMARAEATEAARSGKYDALIACGGDGTIRQAAAAAAGTACPVGAFMLGTGNVLAYELDLPRAPAAMAELLRTGPTLDVQMGLANDEPFLLMAGVGFDGRIMANLNQRLKQRIAKVAFVPATLQALRAPIDRLRVEIDGHTHEGVAWAIVTSAARYGGHFKLTRRTSLRSQGLVATLFYARTRADLVRHATNLARGRLDDLWHYVDSGVSITSCTSAVISSDTAVPVQVDGDVFGTTPLRLRADGPTVALIVPAGL